MHQNNYLPFFLHVVFLLNLLGLLHGRNIEFTVDEELPQGTQIGSLLDHVPGSYSNLQFVKLAQNHDASKLFSVDQFTGAITITSRLDRESLCQEKISMVLPTTTANIPFENKVWEFNVTRPGTCQLHFGVNCLSIRGSSASNNRINGKLIVLFDVSVNIRDLNDNACNFLPSDKQVISLYEDAPIEETRIPINIPYDPDDVSLGHSINLNSIRLYSTIVHDSAIQTTAIDSVELEHTFRINIISPKTSNFMRNIPFETNHSSIFQLELELLKSLDFEKRQSYDFQIKADDGFIGFEHQCTLTLTIHVLDCNDNPPVFEKNLYTANLTENTPIGSLIFQVRATDADSGVNGLISYRFESANFGTLKMFKLNTETGELQLTDRLNYREQAFHSFKIVAENHVNITSGVPDRTRKQSATTSVEIHVTDVNDQAPTIRIFSPTGLPTLEVVEETNPGQDIAIVDVTDGDAGQNAVVDCEITNQSFPGSLKLTFMDETVIQNPNPSTKKRFKITLEKSLDREDSRSPVFTVHCWDGGNPSLTTDASVHLNLIDINDNAPIFRKNIYSVLITEDSDPLRAKNRFEIIKVEATDRDAGPNAQLRYSLDHGTPSVLLGLVKMDAESGTLSSTGSLDREQLDAFSVTVIATDLGDPPRSAHTVINLRILDYNDNSPTFLESSYTFSVKENRPMGEFVGSLLVTDDDIGNNARVKFELEDVVDRVSPFSLPIRLHTTDKDHSAHHDPYSVEHSGLQTTYETNLNSKLTQIRLVSYQLRTIPPALKNLHNSTIYEVQLYTNSIWDREASIPYMKAIATGDFKAMQMSERRLSEELKRVNQSLDVAPYVIIQIKAEDQGSPRLIRRATVRILIEDENDNSPIFLFPDPNTLNVTRVSVSYQEPTGYTFAQIYAIDVDAGANGTVTYYIHSGNSENYFTLDQYTGALHFTHALSFQSIGDYSLELEARDAGQPSRSSFSQLVIGIEDSAPKGLVGKHMYSQSGLLEAGSTSHRFNTYILIAIVVASSVVSVLLLSSICFVLRRSRHSTSYRQSAVSTGTNGLEKTPAQLNSVGGKYTTAYPISSNYTAAPCIDEQPQFYSGLAFRTYSPTMNSTPGTELYDCSVSLVNDRNILQSNRIHPTLLQTHLYPVANMYDCPHSDMRNFEFNLQANQQPETSGDFRHAKPVQIVRTLQGALSPHIDSSVRNFSLSLPRGTSECEGHSATVNGTELLSFGGNKHSIRTPLPTGDYFSPVAAAWPALVSVESNSIQSADCDSGHGDSLDIVSSAGLTYVPCIMTSPTNLRAGRNLC